MIKTQGMRVYLFMAASLLAGCTTTGYGPGIKVGGGGGAVSTDRAAAWFEAHRHRPTMLRAFLQRMPKGGDIHTHASGATYAESFIKWAAEDNLCVDPKSGAIDEDKQAPCGKDGLIPIITAWDDGELYNALIDKLSVRNLAFAGQSGHDQLFESFDKFGGGEKGDQVAEIVTRAAAQHISYVEMMTTIHWPVVALGEQVGFDGDFAGTRGELIAAGLVDQVDDGRAFIAKVEAHVDESLQCNGTEPQPGCSVTRRYLQQNIRVLPPERLYAQLVYAFELVRADPRVVGMNLVAPEDSRIALRDYDLQMAMFGYLTKTYPDVPVSLHAGELTLGLVPPRHLRSHIRKAVEVAGARRIGHGVDIAYEDGAFELMAEMKARESWWRFA